jgi:predicted ArsR family transcriptional regulator
MLQRNFRNQQKEANRERILLVLRQHKLISTNQIAVLSELSYVTARQHLWWLEQDGVVNCIQLPNAFLYSLKKGGNIHTRKSG